MGCSAGSTLKTCLSIFSFFIWCCAVTLIVIGGYILAEFNNIKELSEATDITIPSFVLIGAGIFLFIVGLLGCVGALKENKCCLALFFIIMLIIMVGEVAAVALSYHYQDELTGELSKQMNKMTGDCRNSTLDTSKTECDEVDYFQKTFKCCGVNNYTDWYFSNTTTIPTSCCMNQTALSNVTTCSADVSNVYHIGCVQKISNKFKISFEWILVGTIIITVLQALGLVATIVMLCRSKETPYTNLDGQGYRI